VRRIVRPLVALFFLPHSAVPGEGVVTTYEGVVTRYEVVMTTNEVVVTTYEGD
jgi:hypothetical protein